MVFFMFERFGHVFSRKSFAESLVRNGHGLVKTRLSRFFLGNLKETERCFLGLACYLPLGGGVGARLATLCCFGGQPPRLKSGDFH